MDQSEESKKHIKIGLNPRHSSFIKMAQKRKANTFDLQIQEDLEVRVQKDRHEGVVVSVHNGNRRIRLGLTAWEELMKHRDTINLAIDMIRGVVGAEMSENWYQTVEEDEQGPIKEVEMVPMNHDNLQQENVEHYCGEHQKEKEIVPMNYNELQYMEHYCSGHQEPSETVSDPALEQFIEEEMDTLLQLLD